MRLFPKSKIVGTLGSVWICICIYLFFLVLEFNSRSFWGWIMAGVQTLLLIFLGISALIWADAGRLGKLGLIFLVLGSFGVVLGVINILR